MMLTSLPMLIIEGALFAVAAGLVYGIFGGGSGLFLMPGFYVLLRHFPVAHGQAMQIAITTTAATSAVLGIFAIRVQAKMQHIDFKIVKKLIFGLLTGTILAVLLLNVLPSGLLKHLFGVVVLLVAVWLWLYNQAKDKRNWPLVGIRNYIMTTLIGLIWFLLGVAVFTVPYLQKCGVSMRHAVGAATVVSTLFSAIAALLLMWTGMMHIGSSSQHIGFLNLPLFFIAIIPSAIAAFIGAKISVKLPQHHLKKIYAALIFIIGFLMLV